MNFRLADVFFSSDHGDRSDHIPCGTKFLPEFNFANEQFFCVLRQLIFVIGKKSFFLLGINFRDFQEVAFYLEL